jgi:hypothetical protein
VDFDALYKLKKHRRGEFIRARVLADEFYKLIIPGTVILAGVKLREACRFSSGFRRIQI